MEVAFFYIHEGLMGNETLGPVTPQQLAALHVSGKVKASTSCNQAGTPTWVRFDQIKGLQPLVAQIQARKQAEADAAKAQRDAEREAAQQAKAAQRAEAQAEKESARQVRFEEQQQAAVRKEALRQQAAVDSVHSNRYIVRSLWALLLIGTVVGTVLMTLAIATAESAIQEAAIAAIFAAYFVGGYVVVRSAESISNR